MTLKDAQNQLLPSGGSITAEDGTPAAVTGFDGKTYIENMKKGKIVPEKQDEALATYAHMIYKKDGKINFESIA